MFFRASLFAAMLGTSIAAPAQEAARQPTGKWVAEFADQNCYLSRTYGSDKNELVLAFEQFPMSTGIVIYILKRGNRFDLNKGSTRVNFGQGEPTQAKFSAYRTATTSLRRVQIVIDGDSYKTAAATEVVSVNIPGEVSESFAVPNLKSALRILDECAVDLGEQWGLLPEVQKRLAKPAKAIKPLGELFSPSDYPMEALRKQISGRSQVRVDVDENGYPTDCTLMAPSGSEALDEVTCGILLKRARFEPAIDVAGKSMKTIVVSTVNWVVN